MNSQGENLGSEIISFIKANKNFKIPQESIRQLLEESGDLCLEIFYLLSENSKVLDEEHFTDCLLFKNLKIFKDEELYFLYEGIRNQILLGFDDFFILFRHFLVHFDKKPFQNLFSYLLQNVDFRMRELLITDDLILKIVQRSPVLNHFELKILKIILVNESNLIKEHIESLNIQLKISDCSGSKSFFYHWYKNNKPDGISIEFI